MCVDGRQQGGCQRRARARTLQCQNTGSGAQCPLRAGRLLLANTSPSLAYLWRLVLCRNRPVQNALDLVRTAGKAIGDARLGRGDPHACSSGGLGGPRTARADLFAASAPPVLTLCVLFTCQRCNSS